MVDKFKICKRKGMERYYITYEGKKVTMKYIPKMIKKLTVNIFNIFHENNAKIDNSVSGRLIDFPTREDAERAANEFSARMIMEKFEE